MAVWRFPSHFLRQRSGWKHDPIEPLSFIDSWGRLFQVSWVAVLFMVPFLAGDVFVDPWRMGFNE